jgi:rhodanese-related sulfurtransferase
MRSLEPAELARWRAEGRPHRLIDVRERPEWDFCRLEPAELMPTSEVAAWLPGLIQAPGQAPLVLLCHHGVRSARICALLARAGLVEVWNLRGGIHAWSLEVNSALPRY